MPQKTESMRPFCDAAATISDAVGGGTWLAFAYAALMTLALPSLRQSQFAPAVRRLLCVLWVVGAMAADTQQSVAAPVAAASASRLDALLQQGEEQRRQVQQLEGQLAQASAAQALRERRAAEAAAEIERLKSQPVGVARDLALGERLAQAQVQAGDLAREAAALRLRSDELRAAHRRLLNTCDRILEADQDGRLPAGQRFAWLRLRTAQAEALLSDGGDAAAKALAQRLGQGQGAPSGSQAGELDDPQLLRERADLLRDSADKLRREVSRLQARGDELQRRQRLRERANRVDEDLFAEQSTTRRGSGRSASTSGRGTEAAAAPAADSSAPGPVPLGGGGTFGSGTAAVTVHTGPDPSTLDGLLRVEGPGDPAVKLQALTRAQAELQSLAGDLLRRAAGLEQRAAELGRQK